MQAVDKPPPDALVFKWFDDTEQFALLRIEEAHLDFWASFGWRPLITSREVIFADLDDTRRADEQRYDP
jgi:hypothetical protein